MAKFYPFKDRKKPLTEDEYYRNLGYVKLSDGLWAGPYQKMGIKLKPVLIK